MFVLYVAVVLPFDTCIHFLALILVIIIVIIISFAVLLLADFAFILSSDIKAHTYVIIMIQVLEMSYSGTPPDTPQRRTPAI